MDKRVCQNPRSMGRSPHDTREPFVLVDLSRILDGERQGVARRAGRPAMACARRIVYLSRRAARILWYESDAKAPGGMRQKGAHAWTRKEKE